MKPKSMTLLAGMVILAIVLSMGYSLVIAASPTGEVKTAAAMFGTQIPIPRLELGHGNDWMLLLYDHLVGCTPEGKLSADLGLAYNWEMSPDGLSWTFYLRKGIKFHDGVELTAKDVKFSIEQLMLPDARPASAGVFRQTIKNMEVKDPYTLVIQCKKPFLFLPPFLSDLEGGDSLIIPKDYYERVGQEQFIKRPIGSGPYKFHSQMIGSFIKLEATEKHWRDGVPRFKYMTYLIIPEESTQIAMLKVGDVDIIRVSRDKVKEVMDAGLKVVLKRAQSVLCFYPFMQWTSPVFSDIRFRKALNLAIDKEAIMKHLLGGMVTPVATVPGTSAMTCGGDPSLKPYPYDPEEAKRLIKEAGYEGYEFIMPSSHRPECPELQLIIETVAGYWQKIGLKPKIFMTEFPAWRERWRTQKVQNSIHGGASSVASGCSALIRTFMEKHYSKSPYAIVHIPYLDERLDRAVNSTDLAEVEKLMEEIYRYNYDQYLVVPICDLHGIIATTKRIPTWDPGLSRLNRNYRGLIKER